MILDGTKTGEWHDTNAICPECGALIYIDPSTNATICPNCNMPIVTEQAINIKQGSNTTNSDNEARNSGKKAVDSVSNFIKQIKNDSPDEIKDAAVASGRKVVGSVMGFVGGAVDQIKAEKEEYTRQKKDAENRRKEEIEREIERKEAKERIERQRKKVERTEKKEEGIAYIKTHKPLVLVGAAVLIALIIILCISNANKKARDTRIPVTVGSSQLINMHYENAVKILKDAGFTNITLDPHYDIVLGFWASAGDVESISIGGKTSFSSDNKFNANDPIIIKYHENYSSEPSPKDDSKPEDDTQKSEVEKSIDSAPEILNIDNCQELNELFVAEIVDLSKAKAFVDKYHGKTIELDCIVLDIIKNPKYNTIFDYVLAPGTDQTNIGATLFLLDEIQYFGFKFDQENRPSSVDIGSKLHMQAKISRLQDSYIVLQPQYTKFNGVVTISQDATVSDNTNNGPEISKEVIEQYIDTIIEPSLKDAYGASYRNYTYNKDINGYMFNFAVPGAAQAYVGAKVNSSSADLKIVQELEKSMDNLSELLYKQLNVENSTNITHACVVVLNELDTNKIFYTSIDGQKLLSGLDK